MLRKNRNHVSFKSPSLSINLKLLQHDKNKMKLFIFTFLIVNQAYHEDKGQSTVPFSKSQKLTGKNEINILIPI